MSEYRQTARDLEAAIRKVLDNPKHISGCRLEPDGLIELKETLHAALEAIKTPPAETEDRQPHSVAAPRPVSKA